MAGCYVLAFGEHNELLVLHVVDYLAYFEGKLKRECNCFCGCIEDDDVMGLYDCDLVMI